MTATIMLNIALTAIVSVWSPGPNNIMLLALSGKYGIKKNLKYMCGIWIGCFTLTLITGLLCSTLAAAVPQVVGIMKYLGAAYLVYLAYKTLFRKPPQDNEVGNIPRFYEGFILQVLNVKLILYAVTMYSTYILPNTSNPLVHGLMALYLVFFSATGNLVWACGGAFLKNAYAKYYKIANVIMTLLLGYCVYLVLR